MTVAIILTTLAYALVKFEYLYTRKDPNINETEILDHYAQTDKVDLNAINFKFAFNIEGYFDHKNKNDPRYLRQYLRIVDYHLNGTITASTIPIHECNETDWK